MALALILALVLAAPTLAVAEEPTGFRDFGWGTHDDAMREFLALEGCSWSGTSQLKSKTCPGIRLGDDRFAVTFTFANERFVAYTIWTPQAKFLDLFDIAAAKLGSPHHESGGSRSTWKWKGASAELVEWCGRSNNSCLQIWTPAYTRALGQRGAERGKKAAEDF